MDILQLLVFIVIAIVLIMLVGKVSFSKHTQSIHIRLFGMVDFEAHFYEFNDNKNTNQQLLLSFLRLYTKSLFNGSVDVVSLYCKL